MTLHFEVISRFQAAANADALLYTPLNAGLTFRRSRVYTVEISGDEQKAREYLLSVLVDPISQECTEQAAPILKDSLFTIDYGMKAGALDLEKEAILQNYRGRQNMGFTLDGLKITQRVYVFGQGDKEALAGALCQGRLQPRHSQLDHRLTPLLPHPHVRQNLPHRSREGPEQRRTA